MISSNQLLIDKNCPMCSLYGKCFIYFDLLQPNELVYYQDVDDEVFEKVDAERAKSEVALIHAEKGTTVYGVDAFMLVLFQNWPTILRFFHLPLIHFLVVKLYRFISFNRHVISGERMAIVKRDCHPPVHLAYRWLYILLVAIGTGFIVNQFSIHLDYALGLQHHHSREFIICFGQVLWQLVAVSIINPLKRMDYLGNMSTVSFIGALLLLPHIVLANWVGLPLIVLGLYFSLVVGTMFVLHVKRCKSLGLPFAMSISWVAFRSVALLIILYLI